MITWILNLILDFLSVFASLRWKFEFLMHFKIETLARTSCPGRFGTNIRPTYAD